MTLKVRMFAVYPPPDFHLGGCLTGRIVGPGMRYSIGRWRPCSFENGVVPRVSPDDAVFTVVKAAAEKG